MWWFSRAQKEEGLCGPWNKALLSSVEKINAWFSHAEKVNAVVLENAVGVVQS